jgi:hypothetical protein
MKKYNFLASSSAIGWQWRLRRLGPETVGLLRSGPERLARAKVAPVLAPRRLRTGRGVDIRWMRLGAGQVATCKSAPAVICRCSRDRSRLNSEARTGSLNVARAGSNSNVSPMRHRTK